VQINDIDNSRIVEDIHIPYEVTNDVVDELVKSSISALDKTHVFVESISDIQDALVESSTLSHDARCSLSTLMIEKVIEHEIVATSVDTSESLGCLPIVYHVSVSPFSDYLEFFHEFFQTSVGPSNLYQ